MKGRGTAVLLIVGIAGAWTAMPTAATTSPAATAALPNDAKTIAHVLNRIGFGPRPGDIQRVQAMGLERYIDEQLHPERIPDAGMSAHLAGFETTGLTT